MALTKPKTTQIHAPSAKKRRFMMLGKNIFRITACVFLALQNFELAAIIFAGGELINILEEFA